MTNEIAKLTTKGRRIGAGTILLIAAIVLIALLGLAFCGGQFLIHRQVQAELARIRAAGEPVTAADLETFYALPASSGDATPLWMTALRAVSQPQFKTDSENLPLLGGSGTGTLPDPGDPWPQQDEVEQFLDKYADLLASLHEAAALGGAARYPTRFSDGSAMTFQPRPSLRLLAKLLVLESEVHARHGDVHAAAQSIHAIFAVARSLEYEPLLVSQLLRLAAERAAVDYFERLLMTVDLADEDLAMIDSDLESIDYYQSFHRSMLGQRVLGMQTFAHPEELGPDAPSAVTSAIFGEGDLALYLQTMNELVSLPETGNQWLLSGVAEGTHARILETPANWRYRVTQGVLPSLQAFTHSLGRGMARRDAAHLAIALERYHHRHGGWPKSLDDLVPEFAQVVPTDPFGTTPMKLLIEDGECRVYSLGPDGIDQGGRVDDAPVPVDIVFRVLSRKEPASADTKQTAP